MKILRDFNIHIFCNFLYIDICIKKDIQIINIDRYHILRNKRII